MNIYNYNKNNNIYNTNNYIWIIPRIFITHIIIFFILKIWIIIKIIILQHK